MAQIQIKNRLLKTIQVLEIAGISRRVAEKHAYIRAAEALQKLGYRSGDSLKIVDEAMAEIREEEDYV